MKYAVELTTTGIGSGIKMIAEGDLEKMEWSTEYRDSHELRVRKFYCYERKSKRHGWVKTAQLGGWDRRNDTLTDMPCPPPELCSMAIKKWGEISVNWADWNIR
jgi:hypothetical protein